METIAQANVDEKDKLKIYSLQAHQDGIPLKDYKKLLSLINKKRPSERVSHVNSKIVALPDIEIHDDAYIYFFAHTKEKRTFIQSYMVLKKKKIERK